MADNVAITAGSGTSVATDEVGSDHYQKIKLGVGVADSAVMIGHLEDAAHTTGDGGVMMLAVRKDSAAALAGTDGDYIPLIVDSTGRLWIHSADLATLAGAVSGTEMQVDVVAALPAGTNAIGKLAANSGVDIGDVDVTSVIPGTGATNLGKATDSAAGATDTGVPPLAVRDDALSALTPIEGDYVPLRVDSTGGLWVSSANLATLAGAVSGTEMQVDVVAALPAGTNAIGKLAANSGVDIGDVDVTSVPAPLSTTGGGTEATALRVTVASDSTGVLSVDDNGGALTVDNGGTFAVQAASAGDVAHDGADSGNPVKIGAVARTTNVAAVADGDRVNTSADDVGRLIVVPNSPRDLVVQQTTDTTNQTETTIVTAGAAGVFHDLLHLAITNASATATVVTLRDASAGSAVGKYALAANGGIVLSFPTPFKQTTAANNWTVQSSATVNLHIVAQAAKNV